MLNSLLFVYNIIDNSKRRVVLAVFNPFAATRNWLKQGNDCRSASPWTFVFY